MAQMACQQVLSDLLKQKDTGSPVWPNSVGDGAMAIEPETGRCLLSVKPRTTQGQRTLNCSSSNDLQQVVVIPAATATFHGQARAVGMLFQE